MSDVAKVRFPYIRRFSPGGAIRFGSLEVEAAELEGLSDTERDALVWARLGDLGVTRAGQDAIKLEYFNAMMKAVTK